MNEREKIKAESTVPVQSRVSLYSLVALDRFWSGSGVKVTSMSQLVSWSLDLFVEQLRNGRMALMPQTLTEAHRHMEERGLYQKGMKDRMTKRLSMAMAFENMRQEGIRPETYSPQQFNTVHRGKRPLPSDEEIAKAMAIADREIAAGRGAFAMAKSDKTAESITVDNQTKPYERKEEGVVREGMSEEEFAKREKEDMDQLLREKLEMEAWLEKSSQGEEEAS